MHQNRFNAVVLKANFTDHNIGITGNLLETQNLRLHLRPTELGSPGSGPHDLLGQALWVPVVHPGWRPMAQGL